MHPSLLDQLSCTNANYMKYMQAVTNDKNVQENFLEPSCEKDC